MTFSFGASEASRLTVEIESSLPPEAGRQRDDDWLMVRIRVASGGLGGEVKAMLVTGELAEFLSELRALHQNLTGSAEFKTLEDQLRLKATGDGLGHIVMDGEVVDSLYENRLKFTLPFDQTQLLESIRDLEVVLAAPREG